MTTIELPTKTFGRKAKKEVKKILGRVLYFKNHHNMTNVYTPDNNHIGYVSHSKMGMTNATLRIF